MVVKHDDSGAGDGNVVLDLRPMHHAEDPVAWLTAQVDALPAWYRNDLLLGGVVEERIAGERFSSPSAQVDIRPSGEVVVLATHEQVLGGEGGQVYLGCRFPADPAYAPRLAEHAARIGAALAAEGALGRFQRRLRGRRRRVGCVGRLRDRGATCARAARPIPTPRFGTSFRAATTWRPARWVAEDGATRAYTSTDNLVDESWLGLEPVRRHRLRSLERGSSSTP